MQVVAFCKQVLILYNNDSNFLTLKVAWYPRKRAVTFQRIEIFKRNLVHTWFLLLLLSNNKVCAIFKFIFLPKLLKLLCVFVLELFPTLFSKISISFQKHTARKNRAHLFSEQRFFLAKLKFEKHNAKGFRSWSFSYVK